MKKIFLFLSIICLSFFIFSPVLASSDLDDFIKRVNVEAQADLGAFKLRLSTQFGVPVPKVEAIMASVRTPGIPHRRLSSMWKRRTSAICQPCGERSGIPKRRPLGVA
jgi:hypothetical protein